MRNAGCVAAPMRVAPALRVSARVVRHVFECAARVLRIADTCVRMVDSMRNASALRAQYV